MPTAAGSLETPPNGLLFFGTFNPIHIGHLMMAETARSLLGYGRVYFIPAGTPPFKANHTDLLDAKDRLKLTRLATADNPRFEVLPIETLREGPSYTYDTLVALKGTYWQEKPAVLMGSDALAGLPGWHRAQQLCEMIHFVQVPRPESPPVTILTCQGQPYTLSTTVVSMPPVAISSSWIRSRLAEEKSVRYWLPSSVMQYITDNQLFISHSPWPTGN